jgi:spore cortex formation protein SpoVR/YcgB (stage V sporulation)
MKTIKSFINASQSISLQITYPHWSSGKKIQQTFVFLNDKKGILAYKKSVKRFLAKGYKLIK